MDTRKIAYSMLLTTGKKVKIAVIDSGVNPDFPLLQRRTGKVFNCFKEGTEFRIVELKQTENCDRNGHGTYVETCIRTVAPDAELDHYRVLDENNNCSGSLLCHVLEYVVGLKYHVVNLSLGTRNDQYVPWLVSILKRAYEGEVTIVAASSNVGNSLYPSRFPECISCEAINAQHPLQITFKPRSVIEFAAWGVNIPIEGPQDKVYHVTGSSYAAAHITGLAARAIEALGVRSSLDVKLALRNFALEVKNNVNSVSA